MKVSINRERYYNHQCPTVPKNVWDAFYSRLFVATRNRINISKLKSINTLSIRINQAYEGSNKFHFYVSINGLDEFHMEIYRNETNDWWTVGGKIDKGAVKRHPRYEWLDVFECNNIDVGPNKARQKLNEYWEIVNQKKKTKDRVKRLRTDIETLFRLQKEYPNFKKC